jgi:hypothetical protein
MSDLPFFSQTVAKARAAAECLAGRRIRRAG